MTQAKDATAMEANGEPSDELTTAVHDFVSAVADNKLGDWLGKPATRTQFVNTLHEETGFPKFPLRLAYAWVLLPVVNQVGKAAGDQVELLMANAAKALDRSFGINAAALLKRMQAWLSKPEAAQPGPGLAITQKLLDRLNNIELLFKGQQPPLDLDTVPATSALSRYSYTTRSTTFVGRKPELVELNRFLDALERRVSWWAIVGPGASGKSRLALEAMLSADVIWHAGFLPKEALHFDWNAWNPFQPTLITIDDAGSEAATIGAMLHVLSKRANNGELDWPVRVLMLERQDQWLSDLARDEQRLTVHIEPTRFAEPLHLAPLAEPDLSAIVRELAPKVDESALAAALAWCAREDGRGRPLFAMLAGNAVSEGVNPNQREKVLQERINRWFQACTDEDRRVLAFATMCRPLRFTDLSRAAALGAPLPTKDYRATASRLEAALGRPLKDWIPPVDPDLIGELFVLDLFENSLRPYGTEADELTRAAWQIAPTPFELFLHRCLDDFAEHVEVLSILEQPSVDSPDVQHIWAATVGAAVDKMFSNGRDAEAKQLVGRLRKACGVDPDRVVYSELCDATGVAIDFALKAGSDADAWTAFDDLTAVPFPTSMAAAAPDVVPTVEEMLRGNFPAWPDSDRDPGEALHSVMFGLIDHFVEPLTVRLENAILDLRAGLPNPLGSYDPAPVQKLSEFLTRAADACPEGSPGQASLKGDLRSCDYFREREAELPEAAEHGKTFDVLGNLNAVMGKINEGLKPLVDEFYRSLNEMNASGRHEEAAGKIIKGLQYLTGEPHAELREIMTTTLEALVRRTLVHRAISGVGRRQERAEFRTSRKPTQCAYRK